MFILRLLLFLPFLLSAETFPLVFHKAPTPLSPEATIEDWPRFFGPRDNCTSNEGPLLKTFPAEGPSPVFELARGDSYSSPILVDGKLLHFHALDSKETLDCHDAETGKRLWTFNYPIKYRDRYGFSSGPRSSPVVHLDRIYLIGVTAMLHCLDLKTGKPLWKRDLMKEFQIPQYFFGYGPNPVVHGKHLIMNIGGRENKTSGTCVAAFHLNDGTTAWKHEDQWGASYASPIVTKLHGQDVALVLAAGESKPPQGGLLALDPKTGKLHSRFPWRADIYESVLASTPLTLPNNQVFISECYELGGVLLQFNENLQPTPLWKNRLFGMHMMIPLIAKNHLYGFAGRNIPDTELKSLHIPSGKLIWQNEMRWKEEERVTGLFRASFLKTEDRTFALGEDGSFLELQLTPQKPITLQRTRFFYARETWTPPVIHRGLLYIAQNSRGFDGSVKRLVCYDLRAKEK